MELDAAETERLRLGSAPAGRLRISVPLINGLIMPLIKAFHDAYPEIELDLDLSDRIVDVVEEGFDAVIRIGVPADSRLTSRALGIMAA